MILEGGISTALIRVRRVPQKRTIHRPLSTPKEIEQLYQYVLQHHLLRAIPRLRTPPNRRCLPKPSVHRQRVPDP